MRARLKFWGAGFVVLLALAGLPACDKKKAPDDAPNGGGGGGGAGTVGALGLSTSSKSHMRESVNNLVQIGLALHTVHDTYNRLPGGYYGPDGKTLGLSWRVAILPYIEQDHLFKQFKLDEPWDSDHNKKLIGRMPPQFAPPGNLTPAGYTYYRAFTGPEAAFRLDPPRPAGGGVKEASARRFTDFTDGLTNTIVVAEGAEAVIWTKPDELELTASGPLPRLGGVFTEGANVLMGDGSVRFLPVGTPPKIVRALITAAGGEVAEFPDR